MKKLWWYLIKSQIFIGAEYYIDKVQINIGNKLEK